MVLNIGLNVLFGFMWDCRGNNTNSSKTAYVTHDENLLHVNTTYPVDVDTNCGLVVRVLDYRCRGPGFDSRALKKKSSGSRGLRPWSLVLV
jgi:hypothetical protein